MQDAAAPSRWNARLALWLACTWVAAGALFKLLSGSPNDLPATIRDFPLLRPEWTFKLAIGVELSIVILALARPRVGWVLLALLFAFFDLLLWRMMVKGEASCGCFGSHVPLKPWHMMAIDSVLLVALLASRVWRGFAKRPLKPLPLLPLFAIVIAAPWYYIRGEKVVQTAGGEKIVPSGEFKELRAETWEGELLDQIGLVPYLAGGAESVFQIVPPAYVVLYRLSCEHCKLHFEKMLEQPITDRQVVLIRIPDDAGATDVVTPVKPPGALELELKELKRGYGITTPVAFQVDENYMVTDVQVRPVEQGAEQDGK